MEELTGPQPPPRYRPGAASMHDVAAMLHRARRDHGFEVYGSLLQVGNGRDPAVDELQEALDGLVYRLHAVIERRAVVEALAAFRVRLAEGSPVLTGGAVLALFDEMLGEDGLRGQADAVAAALLRQSGGEPA